MQLLNDFKNEDKDEMSHVCSYSGAPFHVHGYALSHAILDPTFSTPSLSLYIYTDDRSSLVEISIVTTEES